MNYSFDSLILQNCSLGIITNHYAPFSRNEIVFYCSPPDLANNDVWRADFLQNPKGPINIPIDCLKMLTQEHLDDPSFELEIEELLQKFLSCEASDAIRLAYEQGIFTFDMKLDNLIQDSLIHYSARYASQHAFEFLINQPYFQNDANMLLQLTNSELHTVLHCAVYHCNAAVLQILLNYLKRLKDQHIISSTEYSNFFNAKTKFENSCLHFCVTRNNFNAIPLLLLAGCNISVSDKQGNTVFHVASEKNNVEALHHLINYFIVEMENKEEGKNILKTELSRLNAANRVPVLLCTEQEVIELLLLYGDNEEVISKDIGRLIHYAATFNNKLLAQCLIKLNVQLDVKNPKAFTPLKIAAKKGFEELAEILLKGGANPDFKGRSPGFTALNNASQFGHLGVVKLLLDHGASIGDRTMSNTSLHSAAYGGHSEVIEYLLKEKNVDPNLTNINNKIPLYQAITQGHISCVNMLLRYGADPNTILTKEKDTCVHFAVKEDRKQILKCLLEHKAKPDEPLTDGTTPLMLAAQTDNVGFIPQIMSHGITLARKDLKGNTVLHIIAQNDSVACAKYILRRIGLMSGITQEFQLFRNKNEENKTPYDIAKERQNENVLQIFIKYASRGFFIKHASNLFDLYDLQLHDTIGSILNDIIKYETTDDGTKYVSFSAHFLDSDSLGICPGEDQFKYNQHTFLHKLRDCHNPELKFHPLVNCVVKSKLDLYKYWALINIAKLVFILITFQIFVNSCSFESILSVILYFVSGVFILDFTLFREVLNFKFAMLHFKSDIDEKNDVEFEWREKFDALEIFKQNRIVNFILEIKAKFSYFSKFAHLVILNEFRIFELFSAISLIIYILSTFMFPSQSFFYVSLFMAFECFAGLKNTFVFPDLYATIINQLRILREAFPLFLLLSSIGIICLSVIQRNLLPSSVEHDYTQFAYFVLLILSLYLTVMTIQTTTTNEQFKKYNIHQSRLNLIVEIEQSCEYEFIWSLILWLFGLDRTVDVWKKGFTFRKFACLNEFKISPCKWHAIVRESPSKWTNDLIRDSHSNISRLTDFVNSNFGQSSRAQDELHSKIDFLTDEINRVKTAFSCNLK